MVVDFGMEKVVQFRGEFDASWTTTCYYCHEHFSRLIIALILANDTEVQKVPAFLIGQ
jgi:hypothetical protein